MLDCSTDYDDFDGVSSSYIRRQAACSELASFTIMVARQFQTHVPPRPDYPDWIFWCIWPLSLKQPGHLHANRLKTGVSSRKVFLIFLPL